MYTLNVVTNFNNNNNQVQEYVWFVSKSHKIGVIEFSYYYCELLCKTLYRAYISAQTRTKIKLQNETLTSLTNNFEKHLLS